jgi:hypothetical protein
VIKDVGERVWRMLTGEASHKQTVEGRAEDNSTIAGIIYHLWMPKAPVKVVGKSTFI